jgi:hypothetical protein
MSLYEYLGFPQALSLGIVALAAGLALTPWFQGTAGPVPVPTAGDRIRRFLRWVGPLFLVISLIGFVPSSRLGTPGVVSPRWAMKVEQTQEFNNLPSSSGSTLKEIYVSANSAFLSMVRNAPAQRTQLFYLCGSAGSGKSFIVDNSGLPDVDIIKLSQLKNLPSHIDAIDLASTDGQVEINRLPSLRDLEHQDVVEFLRSLMHGSSASTLIIDDLDEIHPDVAKWLLRKLEAFVSSQAATASLLPNKIVVVGRPEGFSPWLRSEERRPPAGVASPTVLVVPNLFERAILGVLLSDYRKFKFNDTSPLKDAEKRSLWNLIDHYPFLRSSLGNLALSNLIMEEALIEVQQAPMPSFELRDRLFDGLLERNFETHGRPKGTDDVYVRAFEKIAAAYSTKAKLDKFGYFYVTFEDTVTAKDAKGSDITFKTRDVLDRSGLIFLNPADYRIIRYRFEPLWLQLHLIERYNRRLKPNYQLSF